MSRQRYNLMLVLLAAVVLTVLHEYGPQGLYRYHNHAHALHVFTLILLWLLFATHVFLATVMWTQRRRWDAAEGSIFRFVCAKGLFWAFAALTAPQRPGINLSTTYLIALLLVTTIDLDIQMIRRYIFYRRDDETDHRRGDRGGTAASVRMAEHGLAWTDEANPLEATP